MTVPHWSGVADAAREWHRLGYRLAAWPRSKGKAPQSSDWGKVAADPLRVTDHNNIGVNHGLSGTCCIDIDDLERGRTALAFLGVDVNVLPATTTAWTGRPGCQR